MKTTMRAKPRVVAAVTCTLIVLGGCFAIRHLAASGGEPAQTEPSPVGRTPDLSNLPDVILEPGIEDWVVDRIAGNSGAGYWFYQGPAREVGGLTRPHSCVETEDGTVYILTGPFGTATRLIEVTADGTLSLLMESEGLLEGPMEQCRLGTPVWNPKEKALYLTGPNCLRKVVNKPDGSHWVELSAGIPNNPGMQDGPVRRATFLNRLMGVVCNSRGTFYWLERLPSDYENPRLRRIENGIVSTVSLKRSDSNMLAGDCRLSLGENDDILYISDRAGNPPGILRCDLKTGVATRIAGIDERIDKYKRAGRETDGPALTHFGSNGGYIAGYDPFYNALWLWGNDTLRFRWLKLDGDGWVRTVFGARRPETKAQPFGPEEINSLGVPGEQWRLYMSRNLAVSPRGGVYFASGPGGDLTGIWRAYNKKAQAKKEVKP